MMLEDEYFAENEDVMIDEVANFFVAATQTVQALTCSAMFYYTQLPDKKEKVRAEMKQLFEGKIGRDVSYEQWCEVLDPEKIGDIFYTGLFMTETLRKDPSVPMSITI